MTDSKPQLLIISLSDLASDARILKQIRMFQGRFTVTTCGFGPSPDDRTNHIRLPKRWPKWFKLAQAVLLRLRWYRLAYDIDPVVRRAVLNLRSRTFDAILANDLDTVGIARRISSSSQIHVDLHEYWPGLHDNVKQWRKLRAPYHCWQLNAWVKTCRSVTTVNTSIAERYSSEFGLECQVVPNASEYQELEPVENTGPIRLVHSGGAQPSRRIEMMMNAVSRSSSDVTLDLYLVGEGTAYYESLTELANRLEKRVRILPPVKQSELTATLNQYDVGLTFLPPTNSNNALALPNKLFDYIQARLGLIAGPTPAMEEVIRSSKIGATTSDFSEEALVAVIDALDRSTIRQWKHHSHSAAEALSAQRLSTPWNDAIEAIIQSSKARA